MAKEKKKRKRKKHIIGKKEFLFNFFSLVFMIGIGLYFGGRSLYYYSKQNVKMKEEEMTLNGWIKSNNPIVQNEEEGLHQDKEGYYFKGNVQNNYVKFRNQVFRVIRVNSDESVKIIGEEYAASFMWGDESTYEDSNIRNWLVKTEKESSGVYLDTIPNFSKFLTKTSYTLDTLKNDGVEEGKDSYDDMVSILGIKDYIKANGKNSYLNNKKLFFLLGYDEENQNLYVDEDGSVRPCDSLEGYGIRHVLTISKNMLVSSGDGTKDNPYVIEQGEDTNAIGKFMKLGEDYYIIFYDKDNVLRMHRYGYLPANGGNLKLPYSSTNSIFDMKTRGTLAYYLNRDYLFSLNYGKMLLDFSYPVGEISDDAGYAMENIYQKQVTAKIGLMNIFDFHVVNASEPYYHMNLTSEVGSMEYVVHGNGLLEEVDVREALPVVPVIAVEKSRITGGNGSAEEPYVME